MRESICRQVSTLDHFVDRIEMGVSQDIGGFGDFYEAVE
tara:strand:- start:1106 stop:1222 length:117 start_codon:yes stop_codon:yes gene_type:complete